MVDGANLAHAVADQVGIAALVTLLYSEVVRLYKGDGWARNVVLAAIFGVGVVLTMLDPLQISPGIQIDGRNILIGLASFLLGPAGAAVTLAFGFAIRIPTGGSGLVAGLLGMTLTSAAALAWRWRVGWRLGALRFTDTILLGLLINVSILSLFVLPWHLALDVLRTGGLVVIASNLFGSLLVGSLLAREDKRILAESTERLTSRTDPLTGLANRRGFEESLSAVGYTKGGGTRLTLLLVDVDKFKAINDTYGHVRGDQALQEIAGIIRRHIRAHDLAARLGGDEFVIVLDGATVKVARDVAERICRSVRHRFGGPDEMPVTVSIGIAGVQSRSVDASALISAADAAMYQAKESGGGRVFSREFRHSA